MRSREDVIKGLELCAHETPIEECLRECKYAGGSNEGNCIANVMRDALELLKAQEPVEPVFERTFMSDIEIYDCGKCGTSLGAKGIAKYCMNCGQAVKWE